MFVQTGATINFDKEEQDGDLESKGVRKRSSNPLVQLICLIKNIFQKKPIEPQTPEETLNSILSSTRYKPDSLEEMSQDTKFSKEDIKFMYRAFKQECPDGTVDQEHFVKVYNLILWQEELQWNGKTK